MGYKVKESGDDAGLPGISIRDAGMASHRSDWCVRTWLAVLLLSATVLHAHATERRCDSVEAAVQVLGSGGPELIPARAASSYLLLDRGRGRVLVDIGGGSAQRFAEAGARVEDLDVILLTHLHVDHSGDLPALLKAAYFGSRNQELPVLGPGGAGSFPTTTEWARRLFGAGGAFAYLQDQLRLPMQPVRSGPVIAVHDIEPEEGSIVTAFESDGLRIRATRVRHGIVPALAWRIDLGAHAVVFTGDTNGDDSALVELARGADLLVAHHAVPEGAQGAARALHMPPSVIGRIAGQAQVRGLVLSHRMRRSLGHETESLHEIAKRYDGPVYLADDLDCYAADGGSAP